MSPFDLLLGVALSAQPDDGRYPEIPFLARTCSLCRLLTPTLTLTLTLTFTLTLPPPSPYPYPHP